MSRTSVCHLRKGGSLLCSALLFCSVRFRFDSRPLQDLRCNLSDCTREPRKKGLPSDSRNSMSHILYIWITHTHCVPARRNFSKSSNCRHASYMHRRLIKILWRVCLRGKIHNNFAKTLSSYLNIKWAHIFGQPLTIWLLKTFKNRQRFIVSLLHVASSSGTWRKKLKKN